MIKIIFLASILTMSAYAQTLQFYIPKDGGQFIELGFSSNNITQVDAVSRSRTEVPENNISLRFEKTISPLWAFGVDYVTTTTDGESEVYNGISSSTDSLTINGSRDVALYAFGMIGQFYWKGTYFHPLEEAKRNSNKTNYSTGSHFGLTFGYLFTPTGGIRIDYLPGYSFDYDDDNVDNDERTEGAYTTIAFFKEFLSEGSLYGIELSYLSQAKGSVIVKNGGADQEFDINDSSAVKLKLYPAWNFGLLQVISNISFTNYIAIEEASRTELELGVDFRFNF